MDTREILRILTGTAGAALSGLDQNRESQNTVTRQKMAILMDELARQQQQQNWQKGYDLESKYKNFLMNKPVPENTPTESEVRGGMLTNLIQDPTLLEKNPVYNKLYGSQDKSQSLDQIKAMLASGAIKDPSIIQSPLFKILFGGGAGPSLTPAQRLTEIRAATQERVKSLPSYNPILETIESPEDKKRAAYLQTPEWKKAYSDTIDDILGTGVMSREAAMADIINTVGQETWNRYSPEEQERVITAVMGASQ